MSIAIARTMMVLARSGASIKFSSLPHSQYNKDRVSRVFHTLGNVPVLILRSQTTTSSQRLRISIIASRVHNSIFIKYFPPELQNLVTSPFLASPPLLSQSYRSFKEA